MQIAIMGAGIGGMAAAYDLVKAGHEVTIFEGAGYPGGLAGGFKEPGWQSGRWKSFTTTGFKPIPIFWA